MEIKTFEDGITTYEIQGESLVANLKMFFNYSPVTSEKVYMNDSNVVSCELDLGGIPSYLIVTSVSISFNLFQSVYTTLKLSKITSIEDTNLIEMSDLRGYEELTVRLGKIGNGKSLVYFALNKASTPLHMFTTQAGTSAPIITIKCAYANDSHLKKKSITASCGRVGAYELNLASGKMHFTKSLFNFEGMLMPLNLTLNYDYDNYSFIGLPKKWNFNYQEKISYEEEMYVLYSNGKKYYFRKAMNSNNKYYDILGYGLFTNGVVIIPTH